MIGTTIAGRYKVESLLGEGGMATVYLVQHTAIRKRLALKILRGEFLRVPDAVMRFEREAIAAAQIDHPNVAAASDYGRTEDGAFFLVLELVDGQRLRDVLKAGALPVARALLLAHQITSALVRAHELGIVHRDLKPENIMLTRRGGQDDFVKVLDFGLAKFSFDSMPDAPAAAASGKIAAADSRSHSAPPQLTHKGVLFGTPAYLAPEQAFGEQTDIRSDLYALGVTLYEMLTGRHPFDGSSLMELIQHQLMTPPPPMKERAPQVVVPPQVEQLVMRLLAKRPEDRWQTPTDLLAALDGILAEQGLVVSSPSGVHSASAMARRLDSQPTASSPSSVAAPARPGLLQRWRGSALHARLGRLQARLPGPLQRIPWWVSGAAVVLAVSLPLAMRQKSPETIQSLAQRASPQRTKKVVVKTAPQSQLDGAAASGPAALEVLATQFPADARVYRALIQSYVGQHKLVEAMAAMAKLGAIDPNTGRDDAMVHIIVSALQGSPEASQAAVVLLERDLGAAGVDLLYDLTVKQTHAHWKARLHQSLSRPEVRARAAPPTLVALDLRAAKTCEAKQALLPRVQLEGDHRALAQLKALQTTQGCGFFALQDCWSCLRSGTQLQDVVNALSARTK